MSAYTETMQPLIQFLQQDLNLPATSIHLALRHHDSSPNLLPMTLWQYGLVTLEQLDKIYNWLFSQL
ncbi:DUF2949 domain-containing protein [Roseofilum casamattae]|uniref:DUF2949 domain-containing protein n=1 Tax=Roseofilum casamattae BLCC-M143 TaxID=3022442 RepID=A0ABT7BXS7_9CYAN|nr:DUF2949 domain-containing protein [Roseofilum casamattae]MDJ1183986.1 DUF2949 domain-containing protein [Roseofilum casamattae BLCC-M143]